MVLGGGGDGWELEQRGDGGGGEKWWSEVMAGGCGERCRWW